MESLETKGWGREREREYTKKGEDSEEIDR